MKDNEITVLKDEDGNFYVARTSIIDKEVILCRDLNEIDSCWDFGCHSSENGDSTWERGEREVHTYADVIRLEESETLVINPRTGDGNEKVELTEGGAFFVIEYASEEETKEALEHYSANPHCQDFYQLNIKK